MNVKKILLIGSTGFLGSCLLSRLQTKDLEIEIVNRDIFDLRKSITKTFKTLLENKKYSYVIICAAITDVERCFLDQTLSHQVNVLGTQELLNQVAKHNIIPIFFSSDYVFSGKDVPYQENHARQPNTVYGQQKLNIEQYIEAHFEKYLIFRTSKLMSKKPHIKNILLPIVQSLRDSQAINCFENQWINPVFVEDIADVIKLAIHENIDGMFHLGTNRIFSRVELGQFLALALGCNPELIKPIWLSDIKFSEKRPTHHLLDCKKVTSTLGFHFSEIENSLLAIKQWQTTLSHNNKA